MRPKLNDKDEAILRKKAEKAGMSPSAYLKKLIRSKEVNVISIYTDDLEELIEEVHTASTAMRSIVVTVKSREDGAVYASDIAEMGRLCSEMNKSLTNALKAVYGDRRRLLQASIDNNTEK